MLNARRSQSTLHDYQQLGSSNPAREFVPAATSLKLPSLQGVPQEIVPSLLFAPLFQIALWGKVLYHLSPGALQWPAGTRVNKISADILKRIENRIHQFVLELDLPAMVEVELVENGHLKICVWAFGDHYYPIFYLEMLEAVKPLAKKLRALTEEALILLGSRNLMTWQDIKEFAEDNLEMMYDDEAQLADMKMRFKACGPEVSPFIRGDRKEMAERIERFENIVERLRPKGPKAILVVDFLRTVAKVIRTRWPWEFAVTEHEDIHIELGRVMPILYTDSDDLSQYHYDEMESYWQGGGAVFGEQMVFEANPETFKGKSLLRSLDRFLDEIRNLSLYNKIFLLSDAITAKEDTRNE